MNDWIKRIFSEKVATLIDDYEIRDSQIEVSRFCDEYFETGTTSLVEAPPGTGKSFAYLIPAISRALAATRDKRDKGLENIAPVTTTTDDARVRLLVVTSNIALQSQLITKDLPTIQKLFPSVQFSLAKGRSNYICPIKLGKVNKNKTKVSLSATDTKKLTELLVLANAEAPPFLPDKDKVPLHLHDVWHLIDASSDECKGKNVCDSSGVCPVMIMREAWKTSDVVVTNYDLLFASELYGHSKVLPKYRYLVFDEAHKAAERARSFYGISLTKQGATKTRTILINSTDDLPRKEDKNFVELAAHTLHKYVTEILVRAELVYYSEFDRIRKKDKDKAKKNQNIFVDDLNISAHIVFNNKLENELINITKEASRRSEIEEENIVITSVYNRLLDKLEAVLGATRMFKYLHEDHIFFLESEDKKPISIKSILFNTGKVIGPILDARYSTCLSATLEASGSFDFISNNLGLTNVAEKTVSSPFDLKKNSAIYTPFFNADPRSKGKEYPEEVAKKLLQIVKAVNGRTLGLFTSITAKDIAAAKLRAAKLPFNIYVQGEEDRYVLIDKFKTDVNSVLLGVASFWEGIDVPGESLSVLFIDKVPYTVPGDPMMHGYKIREGSSAPMDKYSSPKAAISLKQAAGRLIRTKTDKGIIVLCDYRATNRWLLPTFGDLRIFVLLKEAMKYVGMQHHGGKP